jgi:hypothetical protein
VNPVIEQRKILGSKKTHNRVQELQQREQKASEFQVRGGINDDDEESEGEQKRDAATSG